MKMKELCLDDRPREKLLAKGPRTLSNAELLAIIIRTGSRDENAVELSRRLIQAAGGCLSGVADMPLSRMVSITGLGRNKAAGISAAIELGRRFMDEKSSIVKSSIVSPDMAFKLVYPQLKGLDHEECWVLFLNRARYVLSMEMVSSGGLSSTILDSKTIIRKALEKHSDGIILAHNHPSGNPRPGKEDIRQTEALRKALSTMDMSLVDHIVIADGAYYSFADEAVTHVT